MAGGGTEGAVGTWTLGDRFIGPTGHRYTKRCLQLLHPRQMVLVLVLRHLVVSVLAVHLASCRPLIVVPVMVLLVLVLAALALALGRAVPPLTLY